MKLPDPGSQAGGQRSPSQGTGCKVVLLGYQDSHCVHGTYFFCFSGRVRRELALLHKAIIVFSFETSCKSQILDDFAYWTNATTCLDTLQASNRDPKAFLFVPPWGFRPFTLYSFSVSCALRACSCIPDVSRTLFGSHFVVFWLDSEVILVAFCKIFYGCAI